MLLEETTKDKEKRKYKFLGKVSTETKDLFTISMIMQALNSNHNPTQLQVGQQYNQDKRNTRFSASVLHYCYISAIYTTCQDSMV